MTSVIAGVGYRNLRDHSLGVIIADDLGERTLSSGVAVLDLSYNPVAVAQWLESLPAHERPSRLVFV
jgi:Ni,Fe-hydrogenase maturation factor